MLSGASRADAEDALQDRRATPLAANIPDLSGAPLHDRDPCTAVGISGV
jgi:hypothetical protein